MTLFILTQMWTTPGNSWNLL